ncbi:MAG TPA: ABC transporter substrate-binding protein [Terriglobales bacterium]|nr:ABC transporter substrate-binding protein [Terriglobales bacterium]
MPQDLTPRRVVCLQPSATVTMAGLGLLDRVVACTKWCVDVCPEAAGNGRMVVQDSWSAQAEEIRAARPDLVVASVPYRAEALEEILRAGVPFLAFAPRTLQDVCRDIAALAGVMGAAENGRRMIDDLEREVAAVRAKTAGLTRPHVFCEEWGKPIIRSQRWVAELVEAAGGEFLGEPGAKTEAASVAAQDPEVIVAAWCGAGDRVPLEKIIRDRGWQQTSAARNRRVFCIPDEYLNTPATTLLMGLRALAAILHPEIFPKLPARVRRMEAS